ncbi:DUF1501 domain-containing protein [Brevundimonas variabilis]|uniref:Uncharacterized protein (DUF1501 family) n=1 Tax=Brevundimonas variabilis TaxID=74312 RepID=A0A7W9FF36_9CAUL|nr:DUF1501 domain-containing protein [Brevundimonas variabilis]MBB5746997.1 uncharacterized protein (DUF1501 family) [Brevundimonas variabilis]
MTGPIHRRRLLSIGGGLTVLGAAAPFAAQLAAAGSAAGQSAPDYRALVCIFMFGGNDSHNMVLATDADSYGRYYAARNTGSSPIALLPPGTAPIPVGAVSSYTGRTALNGSPEHLGGILPIVPRTPQPIPAGTNATTRTFGLHPSLGPLKTLFDAGRLSVVANVGTLVRPITKAQFQGRTAAFPANLFSHNDQQSTWQAGASEGASVGWGGRLGDLITGMNGTNSLFTAISTAGNAVFLSGQNVIQYQVTTGAQPAVVINGTGSTLFGSSVAPSRVRDTIQDQTSDSLFAADYGTVVNRSIAASSNLNVLFGTAAAAAVPAPTPFVNPVNGATEGNSLANQLATVARMIAVSSSLGLKRQVFFVSIGGWDSHDVQNAAQGANLARVAHAMAYFDTVMGNVGGLNMRQNVTTFTASDFSRTFTTNGDGTDHAWGGHHFVMGGSVKGGDIYGQYPTLGVDLGTFRNPDMAGNALVPTTSVDQYAATMGRWLGASESGLDTIFPNLKNFPTRDLGFMT